MPTDADGVRLCTWGSNRFGQLGIGSTDDQDRPVQVKLIPDYQPVALAVGRQHAVVGSEKKILYSWGSNSNGQLGRTRKAEDSAKEPPTKSPEEVKLD